MWIMIIVFDIIDMSQWIKNNPNKSGWDKFMCMGFMIFVSSKALFPSIKRCTQQFIPIMDFVIGKKICAQTYDGWKHRLCIIIHLCHQIQNHD